MTCHNMTGGGGVMTTSASKMQNYDPEIHKEYLIHYVPSSATSFIAMCRLYSIAKTEASDLSHYCDNFLLSL